jgi:uncharacterized repeat protein (TIGR02543 family)
MKKIVSLWMLVLFFIFISMQTQVLVQAEVSEPKALVYQSFFDSNSTINDLIVTTRAFEGRQAYMPRVATFGNKSNLVLLPGGFGFLFNAAFIKEKVDITKVSERGISTFFELDVHKGDTVHTGDFFSIVLSKNLPQTPPARNFTYIPNSLVLNFNYYRGMPGATSEADNYTNLETSVHRNVNGVNEYVGIHKVIDPTYRTDLSKLANFNLVRQYKFWLDINASTNVLELRMRFDNSYERPLTPVATYENIDMNYLGDTFYAGISAASGGLNYGLSLKKWMFANSYIEEGLDATNTTQYISDILPPTEPTVSPVRTENGWKLNPNSTDDSNGTIFYEYQLDDQAIVSESTDFIIPDGTKTVKIWARDLFNKVSPVKTINLYQISLLSNGGIESDKTLWHPAGLNLELEPFTRLGYTFLGFGNEVNTASANIINNILPIKDEQLYAQWQINPYSISFNTNGGTTVNELTQDFDSELLMPANPTKTGFTFDGWYEDETLNIRFEHLRMPSENKTVYAKWSINTYTITFNTNGGSVINPLTQDFDSVLSLQSNPIKTGYTFGGWYIDEALNTSFDLDRMPSEDINVYAKWSINTYTITFNTNGGSVMNPLTQDFDSVITLPSNPTKTHYTFAGWYNQNTLLTSFELVRMSAQNLTIYAKWNLSKEIQDVIDLINAIEPYETLSLFDENDIVSARTAYDTLSDSQKALVTNDQILVDDEAKLFMLKKVNEVKQQMDALPDDVDVIKPDESEIKAARASYEALSELEKTFIPEETLTHLIEAENALKALAGEPLPWFWILPFHILSGLIILVLYRTKIKKGGY